MITKLLIGLLGAGVTAHRGARGQRPASTTDLARTASLPGATTTDATTDDHAAPRPTLNDLSARATRPSTGTIRAARARAATPAPAPAATTADDDEPATSPARATRPSTEPSGLHRWSCRRLVDDAR